jgi:hypothetical protein
VQSNLLEAALAQPTVQVNRNLLNPATSKILPIWFVKEKLTPISIQADCISITGST